MGAGQTFTATAPNGTYTVSVTGHQSQRHRARVRRLSPCVLPGDVDAAGAAPTSLAGNVAGTTVGLRVECADERWGRGELRAGRGTHSRVQRALYVTVPVGADTGLRGAWSAATRHLLCARAGAERRRSEARPAMRCSVTVAGPVAAKRPGQLQAPTVTGSTVALSWSAGGGGALRRASRWLRASSERPSFGHRAADRRGAFRFPMCLPARPT